MNYIFEMYVTLVPVILAGILNMVFVSLPVFRFLKKPMDAGLKLSDGKRLFGDNKTWKGASGMIIISAILQVLWGLMCGSSTWLTLNNLFYRNFHNSVYINIIIGLLLGSMYIIFELPNSYIKRRANIEPGKKIKGSWGIISGIFDQVDSLFGCVLVVSWFYQMSFLYYFTYVILGGVTHIIFNYLLYTFKLKKDI